MLFLVPASVEDLNKGIESSEESPYFIEVKIERAFTRTAKSNGKVEHGMFRMFVRYPADIDVEAENIGSYNIPFRIEFNPSDLTFNQLIDRQIALQAQMNLCINAAEHINNVLRKINTDILTQGDIIRDELQKQYKELMLQDFMGQKERFTKYIKKSDTYKNLLTQEQRRDLDKFVLNRNIYTHGILMVRGKANNFVYHNEMPMLRPWAYQYIFVIEYLNKKDQTNEKAIVTEQIMNDYLEFAKELDRILVDFSNVFDESIIAKRTQKGSES